MTSRKIMKDLKDSMTKPSSKSGMRSASTKKAFKSSKLFSEDKSKQKRFD